MRMKAAIYTGIEEIEVREVERNEPLRGLYSLIRSRPVSVEAICIVISGIGGNRMSTPPGMKRVVWSWHSVTV